MTSPSHSEPGGDVLRDREASWSRGAPPLSLSGWALGYAAANHPVVPLAGKIPRTPNGVHDASSDPAVVLGWWEQWPNANIGLRIDPGFVVLDVDPRNGGDPDALELPETETCYSGRGDGGRHFWFVHPGGDLTGKRLPPGWDLKAKGYCVVPPSVHPDTERRYVWGDPIRNAELPTEIVELLRRPTFTPPSSKFQRPRPGGGYGAAALADECDRVRAAVEGTRNDTLCKAAFSLGQLVAGGVLDADVVMDELIAAARAAGLPDEEIVSTVRSGLDAGSRTPRRAA